MADDSFRPEIDARFDAAHARASAHEARTDARYAELVSKIDALRDVVIAERTNTGEFRAELRTFRSEIQAEGRNTRTTIIITLIASLLAFAGAMWTAQANLLAAFQAGLAKQAALSAPAPPERKASLADAR